MKSLGTILLWLLFPGVMLLVTVVGWCLDHED